jgi:MOSC domain-containing protein YiiM
MTKAPFKGKVHQLLAGPSRAAGLEKSQVEKLTLTLEGIEGDCHIGLTRPADVRTIMLYKRDTPIRNVRQLTLVSVEELHEVAQAMAIPQLKPEWLGANVLVEGIADFTLLPPSTRLQFSSGATIVVDMENLPCRQVANVVARHYPKNSKGLVASAMHKRGVTAWVEREGIINAGDEIILFLPPSRLYPHASA